MNKTFLMLKPDSIDKGLVKTIIGELKKAELMIEEFDIIKVQQEIILEHYKELIERLEPNLRIEERITNTYLDKYVVPMIVYSENEYINENIIKYSRKLVGNTEPIKADRYTIRGKYGEDDTYDEALEQNRLVNNLIHASDSLENAEVEIKLWFNE